MEPAELKAVTAAQMKRRAPASEASKYPWGAPAGKHAEVKAPASLACATCHKEHRGTEHAITALTNAQCLSCHSQSFPSFSRGHPEFETYPFQRRARVFFDHGGHFAKHFVDTKREDISFATCHAPDASGKLLAV